MWENKISITYNICLVCSRVFFRLCGIPICTIDNEIKLSKFVNKPNSVGHKLVTLGDFNFRILSGMVIAVLQKILWDLNSVSAFMSLHCFR